MNRIGLIFNHAVIVGGGELSFLDLAAALRGSDCVPVAMVPEKGPVADRLENLDVETHVVALPPIRAAGAIGCLRAVRNMAGMMRALHLDLAHVNGARAMLYAGWAARRAHIPCIWHVRVLERDRWLDRLRGRWATAVIANSRAVADVLRPLVPAGKPLKVVYNGLDLARWTDAKPADMAALFGLPRELPVLLAVGRLSRWKGFADLIDAFAQLRREGETVACVLVGAPAPGDLRHAGELRRRAEQAGLAGSFVFAGWRDDIPSLMKASTALVLPSHGEPFGRVIIEAWAAGLPVIATAAGGPAELIADGQNGLLCPVGDGPALCSAMRRVITDQSLADRLRAAGKCRAGEFSIQRHADNITGFYKEILQP